MNIAEYVRHPASRKCDRLRRTGLVQAKVKTLPLKQREDIMKERIGVGELYCAAKRNHQQMRYKSAVFLQQSVWSMRREGRQLSPRQSFQPYDRGHAALDAGLG